MQTFPVRLKEVRRSKEVTQKQTAEAIGIFEQSYQKYERGKVKPSYDIVVKLCQFFGISSDYLLGLSDEPRPLHQTEYAMQSTNC